MLLTKDKPVICSQACRVWGGWCVYDNV